MRILFPILTVVGALLWTAPAFAKDTVECLSKSYKYNECNSRSLNKPVLIYQSSDTDCVMNRNWGFSPRDKYIWVSDGCSGVFADSNSSNYSSNQGYDSSGRRANKIRDLYDEGYTAPQDYDGCHGIGCLVDNPDE